MELDTSPRRSALRHATLADKIYQEIRSRLQQGKLQASDRLLDYEVAEEFGCTRMPARQALVRLATESYLQRTTRGFVVSRLSDEEVRELFEMRRVLEPYAAARAADTLNSVQLGALEQAYADTLRAIQSDDTALVCEANVRFRMTWLEALTNQRLKATVQAFSDLAQQVRTETLRLPETREVAAQSMASVLKGFQDKAPETVQAAMQAWVVKAEEAYFKATRGKTDRMSESPERAT